ncbi:MAG TPA: hypothetical protein VIE89_21215 [Candidatus Binatia bacterium]|jgi:hypothetical protein
MTALKALAILEAAVLDCKNRDINTLEVRDALNFLEPHTKPASLVMQFRSHLDHGIEVDKEREQQILRTSFPGIRSSVRDLIRKQMEAQQRRFAVSRDMNLQTEIERLRQEYDKLKRPWVFWGR